MKVTSCKSSGMEVSPTTYNACTFQIIDKWDPNQYAKTCDTMFYLSDGTGAYVWDCDHWTFLDFTGVTQSDWAAKENEAGYIENKPFSNLGKVFKVEDGTLEINPESLPAGPKGDTGERGEQGEQGPKGEPGKDAVIPESVEKLGNELGLGIKYDVYRTGDRVDIYFQGDMKNLTAGYIPNVGSISAGFKPKRNIGVALVLAGGGAAVPLAAGITVHTDGSVSGDFPTIGNVDMTPNGYISYFTDESFPTT